jgi:hypothetical protein
VGSIPTLSRHIDLAPLQGLSHRRGPTLAGAVRRHAEAPSFDSPP